MPPPKAFADLIKRKDFKKGRDKKKEDLYQEKVYNI